MNNHLTSARNLVRNIILIYAVLGTLWIIFSDQLIMLWTNDPIFLTGLQTLKGLGFVFATSLLLYVLSRWSWQSLQQAQEALRTSEELVRTVVTNSPIILYALDQEGLFTLSEGKGLEFLGLKPGQVVGQSVYEFSRDYPETLENIRQVLAGAEGDWLTDYGNVVYENRATPLRDQAGQVTGLIGVATDMTQRQQAVKALQVSEQQFRSLSVCSPVGIFMADTQGRCTYTNPRCQAISGFSLENSLGAGWAQSVHPDDREWVSAEWLACAKAGRECFQEYRFLVKTAQQDASSSEAVRWVHARTSPIFSEQGELIGHVGTIEDITERKRVNEELDIKVQKQTAELSKTVAQLQAEIAEHQLTEAALRESELQLRLALNAAQMGTWDWEIDTGKETWSERTESIFGFTPSTFPGSYEAYFRCIHPADRDTVTQAITRSLQEGSVYNIEYRILWPDGTVRWIAVKGDVLHDSTNQPVQMTGVVMDITERKQVEEALRQSEEQFRQLAENINQVFWIMPPDMSQTLYISPAYEQIWGRSCASLYEQPESFINSIYPEDCERVKELIENNKSGKYDGEYRIIRPDGTVRWIRDRGFPIRDEVGQVYRVVGFAEDITEHRQATEALQESEERFRQLAENINQVFWMVSAENKQTLYVSPAYEQVWGQSCESFYQQPYSFMDTIHPEDRERINAVVSNQGRVETDEEYRIIRPDGSIRWIHDRAFPIRDESGYCYRIAGIAEDITERKQIEEALQSSEERFRKIFEESPIGIATIFPQTNKYFTVNSAFCRMLGYTESELKEGTFIDVTHPEDLEKSTSFVDQLSRGEFPSHNLEKRYLKKNSEVLWANVTCTVIRDSEGRVLCGLAMIVDITQRKRAEEEIRLLQVMKQAVFESQDFHAALTATLQKVCEATTWEFGEAWIPSSDGSVLECSPAWYSCVKSLDEFRKVSEEMTFAPSIGIPGRVWVSRQPEWRQDVSAESGQTYLRAQLAVQYGLKAALGIPIMANDGVLAVLVFYMFESRDEDQRLIELISASTELGLFIQRKQAEEEIYKSLDKERELNELKSRFVSMASHEFRTPLATILLSSGLLENYNSKLNEEKKLRHIRRIQTAVQRMTQMLDDVLLLGKAEAGKLEFNPAPLDLHKFCHGLVDEMQPNDGSQQTINFIHLGECTNTYMDDKLLRHILSNLLSNAIKYSPQGSRVNFVACCQNREVVFQIKDEGIGIPQEDQQRLFESFHRATNVGNISGTGLGLAIVKKSVELHGGKIVIDSQVGIGTTFTVTIPSKK